MLTMTGGVYAGTAAEQLGLSDGAKTAFGALAMPAAGIPFLSEGPAIQTEKRGYSVAEHKVFKTYSNSPLPEGKVERTQRTGLVWDNPECGAGNSCEIKSVRFSAWDYRVTAEGKLSFGVGVASHYKTDAVPSLEKYGFVQWIQGCVFESEVKNGKLNYSHPILRPYWQQTPADPAVVFQHPVLALDSVDRDPVYASSPGIPHPGGYKWNRVEGSVDNDTMVRYFNEKPVIPELYVTDFPATASLTGRGAAINTSLSFKTCLYKISDVPQGVPAESGVFPGALVCYDWNVSYIYNHSKKVFEAWDRIHPECEKPLSDLNVTGLKGERLDSDAVINLQDQEK